MSSDGNAAQHTTAAAGWTAVPSAASGRRAGPWAWLQRRRRQAELLQDLPDVIEIVARSLRSGQNLHGALEDGVAARSPAGVSLSAALRRTESGATLNEALRGWAAEIDHPDAALLSSVLELGHLTGAALATTLDRTAATLRERAELNREIAALTSQTRASALLLTLAPLGFLALLASLDPSSAAVLVSTVPGAACLTAGLLLDTAGFWWMQRIVAGVTR